MQCNSLRLMVHEGCSGLLMDGSDENVNFFNYTAGKLGYDRVRAVQAFITRDNLQGLISGNGVPREIDFLSLDVDGNDFWFWEALECVAPRVVCIEYNASSSAMPSIRAASSTVRPWRHSKRWADARAIT